ncbi:hypothetical protein [Peribacillus butanolivorans]|uniref:hypothetical protein n=1 Tax=Peribacillus butanolivorans TaxID=421767 RepID=UPI0030EB46EB
MSLPILPNFTPTISITTEQTIPLLLASIALEELALAHIINVQAEELQSVLGTLPGGTPISPPFITLADLLAMNSSVQRTLRHVIKKEMLLEFKFENVLDLLTTVPPPIVTVTLASDLSDLGTSDCPPSTPTSATLTGQVLVNGSPPPAGTPVFFTINDPTLGTITPNPALTDASGAFSATFSTTTVPGTAMITATALGQNSNTVTIEIRQCAVLVTVTLNADPTTICVAGTGPNTSTITGQVLVNGSPPLAGTLVSFTIDNPALGTVALNPAPTDVSGNFTATFTATDGPGTVMITATALGASDTVTITIIDNCNVLAAFSFGPAGATICSLGTGPNTIILSGNVLVDGGVPVAGIPVVFTVAPAIGTTVPPATTTDASGNFSTVFTAIDGPGIATVTATLPTFGATISIAVNIVDCP